MNLRPYQRTAIDAIRERWDAGDPNALLVLATGLGKALRNDQRVLRPDGSWTPICEMRVGDFVVGRDGKPTVVVGVYPQGVRPMLAVRFTDGVVVYCDEDHLWTLDTSIATYPRATRGNYTVTAEQLRRMVMDQQRTGCRTVAFEGEGEFKGQCRHVFRVDPAEPAEATCIKVANEDGLFVTEGYVVTHNTVVFCTLGRELRMEGIGKTLVLAHRKELLDQAREKWLAVEPDAHVGIYQGARREFYADVICASVQSCYPDVVDGEGNVTRRGRIHELPLKDIGLVIVDECFPAGTMVDGRPIEQIRVGDAVESYNHHTGETERRRVTRLFKSVPNAMVTVHCDNGKNITCTAGHPFFTRGQYVPAAELAPGDLLYGHTTENLCRVRDDLCSEVMESDDGSDLLPRLQTHPTRPPAETHQRDMPAMQQGIRGGGTTGTRKSEDGPELLFGRVQQIGQGQQERSGHGENESEACVSPHALAEPDATCRDEGESVGFTRRHGSWSEGQGWQRDGTDSSRVGDAVGAQRVDLELRGAGREGARQRMADALQDRRGEPEHEDRDRARWVESLPAVSTRIGRQEGRLSQIARVVRVEVHEQPGGVGPGGLCPDGHVYNIEVEGNHNYFVDGVLVHNCHHLAADTYRGLLTALREHNPNAVMLGVTATPYRNDGKGLGEFYDRVAFRMGIGEGIEQGFLAPLRGCRVELDIDLSQVKTSKRTGDFVESDLGNVMDTEQARREIVRAWQREMSPGTDGGGRDGRFTAAFTPTVESAQHLCQEFEDAGVPAVWVSGSMPKADRIRALDAYQHGKARVIVNCAVLTEGWDAPHTSCVLIARPTQSIGMYAQMVGRGTRLYQGKADCVVMDCVGASRLGLASLADLSTGAESRAPGIDPEEETEDEVVVDKDAKQLDLPELAQTIQVRGCTVYDIDLFGGQVVWTRIRGMRLAILDIGLHIVLYQEPNGGAFTAMLVDETAAIPFCKNRPERECLAEAEQMAMVRGRAKYLKPNKFQARMPATEKQMLNIQRLTAQNVALGGLDARDVPEQMSMPQAMAWIAYLKTRRMWMRTRAAAQGQRAGAAA